MAKYFSEEDVTFKGGRCRQFSDASTCAPASPGFGPSSPPMSPAMSRMVSPWSDYGEWREEIGGDRFEVEFEFSGLEDEVSKVLAPTIQAQQLPTTAHKFADGSEVHSSTGGLIFLPTLFGLCTYGLLNSVNFRIFLAVGAALIVLPGVYLYVVDGCRPEDFTEEDNNSQKSVVAIATALGLFLSTVYGLFTSMVCWIFMSVLAALMFLPGLYLYVVDGCRPEDYEEQKDDTRTDGSAFVVLLVSLVFGSSYGMSSSAVFCVCMGGIAALMLLPGLYLWVVCGCRPEDMEDEENGNEKSALFMFAFITLVLGTLYGICVSMIFRVFFGTMAALMLLPGLYLYMVDGCRPEDYEEEENESQKMGGTSVVLMMCLALSTFYCLHAYMFFWVFMGSVAAMMLLPGLYLWVVHGCRPEDMEEAESVSVPDGASALAIFTLALGTLYGISVSTVFCVFFGAMASLMLLPGLYLYMVDGCRPEDYEEEENEGQKMGGASVILLMSLALSTFYCLHAYTFFWIFMGSVAAMMLLPGLYLWVVHGCRPEDMEEAEGVSVQDGAVVLAFLTLALGALYGMHVSMPFRVLMGIMAALLFLPGLYLYKVDGCRPEDYQEEDIESQKMSVTSVCLLASLTVITCYMLYASLFFRIFMGSVATLMLLPGLYLWVMDGCRPEDMEDEENDSENGAAYERAFSALFLGISYGMYISTVFRVFMSVVAGLMFLPGLYLYWVDGCRPEDYEEEVDDNQKMGGASMFLLVCLAFSTCYGLHAFLAFRIFLGTVAVFMVFPGCVLYLVDGCRPEDYYEESDLKED